jgi:hypothetical protein
MSEVFVGGRWFVKAWGTSVDLFVLWNSGVSRNMNKGDEAQLEGQIYMGLG